jgi:hypothetical protein
MISGASPGARRASRLAGWCHGRRHHRTQREGPSGPTMGHASHHWAGSDAAVWFLRAARGGQQDLANPEQKPSQGQALTALAHNLARVVYDRRQRDPVCDRQQFRHGSGSDVG